MNENQNGNDIAIGLQGQGDDNNDADGLQGHGDNGEDDANGHEGQSDVQSTPKGGGLHLKPKAFYDLQESMKQIEERCSRQQEQQDRLLELMEKALTAANGGSDGGSDAHNSEGAKNTPVGSEAGSGDTMMTRSARELHGDRQPRMFSVPHISAANRTPLGGKGGDARARSYMSAPNPAAQSFHGFSDNGMGQRALGMSDLSQPELLAEVERMRRMLEEQRMMREREDDRGYGLYTPKPERPERFGGDSDEVQSFCRALDRWFSHYNMSEHQKLLYSTELLTDAARMWYDARERVAMEYNCAPFATLEDFKAALREHFLVAGRWSAFRRKLLFLRQRGPLHEYNQSFMEIAAELSDLSISECCFHYVNGLARSVRRQVMQTQTWAAVESNPRSVTPAMFEHLKSHANQAHAMVDQDWTAARVTSGKRKADAVNNLREFVAKLTPAERKKRRAEKRCYICGEKHLARDCPTAEAKAWRATLNTLYDGWSEQDIAYVHNIEQKATPPRENEAPVLFAAEIEDACKESDFDSEPDADE